MNSGPLETNDTSPWDVVATTTIIQALVSMSALIFPVLTPLIVKQLGGSASLLAGTMAGLTYLGAAIFTVIGGPFIFIDESRLSERPTRVRTWAPKGQTLVIQFHFNWKHVSAIAGLSYHNCLFRLYDGAIKSAQIVEFLKALRAHLKRRLMIIWDGAAQHKSRIVRDYLDSTGGAVQMALCPALQPGPESSGISLGLAQAPCPGQLLPTLAHRTQNDRPQSAAQRTATR